MEKGDFIKIKKGTEAKMRDLGIMDESFSGKLDDKDAKITHDYSTESLPHYGVNIAYSKQEIGIPVNCIDLIE